VGALNPSVLTANVVNNLNSLLKARVVNRVLSYNESLCEVVSFDEELHVVFLGDNVPLQLV